MATKIKNIPFVGGDTAEFEFDFGTKVAKSVAECPMKLYGSYTSSLQVPSNITGVVTTGWVEEPAQAQLDKIKSQDNTCLTYSSTGNGIIAQMMIELDLSQLCQSLFGGSNSAMKAALKTITATAYAKGNGASGNSVAFRIWNNDSSHWDGSVANATSNITDITIVATVSLFVNSSNKLYLLLYAPSSDGSIPSETDLDYINIKLQFSRVPDVIAPISITLPSTWNMVIKGVAFAWDSNNNSNTYAWKRVIELMQSSSANRIEFTYDYTNKRFILGGQGITTAYGDTFNLVKFKAYNFIMGYDGTNLYFKCLIDGVVKTYKTAVTLNNFLYNQLYLAQSKNDNSAYLDGFINSVIFIPNKVFDDTEAEAVLRETAEGFEEDELVTDGTFQNGLTSWTDHGAGITAIPGNLIFTTMGSYANQYINVLPNNQYYLDVEGNCACRVYEYYNSIQIKSYCITKGTFTIGDKTNRLAVSLYPAAANQSCSSVSLKLKM